jgi:hypothetical protein
MYLREEASLQLQLGLRELHPRLYGLGTLLDTQARILWGFFFGTVGAVRTGFFDRFASAFFDLI